MTQFGLDFCLNMVPIISYPLHPHCIHCIGVFVPRLCSHPLRILLLPCVVFLGVPGATRPASGVGRCLAKESMEGKLFILCRVKMCGLYNVCCVVHQVCGFLDFQPWPAPLAELVAECFCVVLSLCSNFKAASQQISPSMQGRDLFPAFHSAPRRSEGRVLLEERLRTCGATPRRWCPGPGTNSIPDTPCDIIQFIYSVYVCV